MSAPASLNSLNTATKTTNFTDDLDEPYIFAMDSSVRSFWPGSCVYKAFVDLMVKFFTAIEEDTKVKLEKDTNKTKSQVSEEIWMEGGLAKRVYAALGMKSTVKLETTTAVLLLKRFAAQLLHRRAKLLVFRGTPLHFYTRDGVQHARFHPEVEEEYLANKTLGGSAVLDRLLWMKTRSALEFTLKQRTAKVVAEDSLVLVDTLVESLSNMTINMKSEDDDYVVVDPTSDCN